MQLDNDTIGRLGHGICMNLCDLANLIPNSSTVDKTGWDVLAEFKDALLERPTTAATLHEGAPQCRIQVKTTTKKKNRSAKIALTNMHRMATDHMPVFVLLVRLDKRANYAVRGIDLVHVDQPLIAKILECVHREGAKGNEARPLNRVEMSVAGKRGTVIEEGDGAGFRTALLRCIGDSFDDYVTEKRRFAAEVGFENGYGTVRITMSAEAGGPDIGDLMLGKTDRLTIDRFVAVSERFGVPDALPYMDEQGGHVEMPGRVSEPATVIFKTQPLMVPIEACVSIYRTVFGDDVADEHHRIRIVGSFFEIEFIRTPAGYAMEPMVIDLGRPTTLSELADATRLLEEWSDPEATPSAIIRRHDDSPDVCLSLNGEFSGGLPPTEVFDVVRHATRIVESSRGRLDSHRVTLKDLVRLRNPLRTLDLMLSENKGSLRLQLGTDITSTRAKDKSLTLICAMGVSIGNALYVVVVLVTSDSMVEVEESATVYTAGHEVLDRMVLDKTSNDTPALYSKLEQIADRFGSDHDVHVLKFFEGESLRAAGTPKLPSTPEPPVTDPPISTDTAF